MSDAADRECRAVLEIRNKLGLHARAAVQLVQTAQRFRAEVWVSKDGERVSGRSIMGVMTLAATQGSYIEIEANGDDAGEALAAITALVEGRFNEEA
jgi:phosphocarrier protein HPr